MTTSSSSMSPLAEELVSQVLWPNIKVPEMPQYDIAQGNPYDHINKFKNKLSMYAHKILYCKLFPVTFIREAIDWYV